MLWRDWIQHNADKILLVFIWLVTLSFVWHLLGRPGISAENISWAREAAGTVLGAILGLITGVAMARRPTDPTGPEDSHSATTTTVEKTSTGTAPSADSLVGKQ